jgi:hypothetical protein
MKKTYWLFLIICVTSFAQETTLDRKKNEFRVDFLNLLIAKKYSFSYEYFLKNDFSVGLSTVLSANSHLKEDFESGYRNNLTKLEINPYFRYALSKSKTRYYFVETFVSYNKGDFKEVVLQPETNGTSFYDFKITSYSDVAIGAGVGFKQYIKESFAIEVLISGGRNLIDTKKSQDYISRVGINLGYRF